MDARHRAGRCAEELAACGLRLYGIDILAHNVRLAGVEVDLLARDGRRLLLVEVKLRRPESPLVATQAVGPVQRRRLRRAAQAALSRCRWAEAVRIDLVGITWSPHTPHVHFEHVADIG